MVRRLADPYSRFGSLRLRITLLHLLLGAPSQFYVNLFTYSVLALPHKDYGFSVCSFICTVHTGSVW